MNLRNQMVS